MAIVLHVMFWRWGQGDKVLYSFFTVNLGTDYNSIPFGIKLTRWGLSPRVMLSSSDIFIANLLGIAIPIVLNFGAAFVYFKKP